MMRPPLLIARFSSFRPAAIAYEILLMRVLSIVQWHHFAWMIISLALLGYGASGTVIALARQFPGSHGSRRRFRSAPCCSASPWSCAWRWASACRSMPWKSSGIPGSSCIWPNCTCCSCCLSSSRPRASDWPSLHGARPSIASIFPTCWARGWAPRWSSPLLFLLPPQRAVIGLAALALAGVRLVSASAIHAEPWRKGLALLQFAWLLGLLYALPEDRIGLQISQFKGLSQALAGRGRARAGGAFRPAGPVDGGGKPAGAVPSRARAQFQHAVPAARPAGACSRTPRGSVSSRHSMAISRRPGLPRRRDRGAALSAARATARARAGRRRRIRCAAGAVPRRQSRSTRSNSIRR